MAAFACVALIVLASSVLRGLTGFGFALAAVPLMAFVIPPGEAVVTAVLLQCMMAVWDVVIRPRPLDRSFLRHLLTGAILGAPIGAALLVIASDAVVRVAVGLAVLIGVFGLWLKIRTIPSVLKERLTGVTAGLLAGLAGIPGPPVVFYAMATGREGPKIRETFMVFFGIAAFLALPVVALGGLVDKQTLFSAVGLLPLVVVGGVVGRYLALALPGVLIRQVTAGLLVASAAATLWKAFSGM
jgi:uncharacterized membrane protein YfcA